MSEAGDTPPAFRTGAIRVGLAALFALAFAAAIYALIRYANPHEGFVAFGFLLLLPTGLSAFVAYVGDPLFRRGSGYYVLVPFALMAATVLISIFALKEGAICVVMLSPLWLMMGAGGSLLVYAVRGRIAARERTYCAAMLLVPLAAILADPLVEWPIEARTVSRAVVIDAPAERIWPHLLSMRGIGADEGRRNLSQDLIGVARPVDAVMRGQGVGAVRMARWQGSIHFEERITGWREQRALDWRFHFTDDSIANYHDPHLRPDGPTLRIESGGYRLEPLTGGGTRVTLHTRYAMRTPVNRYAALWGELFLGDIQDNVLEIVRQRAERHPAR